MATSTQRPIFTTLTYNDDIKNAIIKSGGTIVFTKDNIIVASEISESQYRELLKNPYIEKIDILPLKRYKNELTPYIEKTFNNVSTKNFNIKAINEVVSETNTTKSNINNVTTNNNQSTNTNPPTNTQNTNSGG